MAANLPCIGRRGALGAPVYVVSWLGIFGWSSSEADAAASEEVLRASSLLLAKTYLRAPDFREYELWQTSCAVVENRAVRHETSFHNRFSFPVKFSKDFGMRESQISNGGTHFGVKELPQINTTGRFVSEGDVNAAEIVSISHMVQEHLAIPVAVSPRRPVSEKEREEFNFTLGRHSDFIPEDVENIFYSRTVIMDTAAHSGRKLIGFGFSATQQPGIGRFIIRLT